MIYFVLVKTLYVIFSCHSFDCSNPFDP
uniref:Uncharacterized protein n=1 Tax=Rhizophora mucronata TaxID=61149 RepID=A0A2P2QU36_RHIMU